MDSVLTLYLQVYCDVTAQVKPRTLIAIFSNFDKVSWIYDDRLWWYDQNVTKGTTSEPSNNAHMISPAFWLVNGSEFNITPSDDSSHTPLLQTTGNCLGGQTFRSKITSYGDFRNGKVWSKHRCLGSCTVQYGGRYKTTDGFQQAECSSNIQSSNKIGFWCSYGIHGLVYIFKSIMMIGGGGPACANSDHGIGITAIKKDPRAKYKYDFGNTARQSYHPTPSQSYSLNLWIR